ncbi:hypothetical protein [Roseateles oligotrophus]|uniref:Uncharacterized protein n=1 Tax=Roseateles oligotrophus TaxID=1769250 RepID=A0ABT2YG66_9BURK|nr:hypothetical protein [Roseateles oligotrophus]MCV2369051.1 hypothetical protein [Roseateles oligotrophus]
MPYFLMFKCATCNTVATGPEAPPLDSDGPTVGTSYGKRPGLACPTSTWHANLIYTGKEMRPPKAPPMTPKGPPEVLLPSAWTEVGDGKFVKTLKYPNIPEAAQISLIAALEIALGDADNRVSLLGASFDRFDNYGDVEDVAIKDLASAEKWLTIPLVLNRLQSVAKALGGTDLWKLAHLDRNFDGKALDLMLPSGVDGCRFHLELLNDLVNPRGGHSVAADTYAQAIKKAIVLRRANTAGNDERGPNRSYYFISTQSRRGLNVVMNGATQVLTVYYSGAATAWSTRAMTDELRAERTVA